MQTLADLARDCAQETSRFFRDQNYDPRYCFELFRKAILERDQFAWDAVFAQYGPLVSRWVQQHSRFEATGEEVQYFVNRAFEKIWVALAPEKFQAFTELGPLLRYLKMCVHSVISDYGRSQELAELLSLAEESAVEIADSSPSLEEKALERTDRLKFWEAVNLRLQDEKERRVVYDSFVLGLKPRQVFERMSGLFASIDEIYLVKQNVLARLRRDPEIRLFL